MEIASQLLLRPGHVGLYPVAPHIRNQDERKQLVSFCLGSLHNTRTSKFVYLVAKLVILSIMLENQPQPPPPFHCAQLEGTWRSWTVAKSETLNSPSASIGQFVVGSSTAPECPMVEMPALFPFLSCATQLVILHVPRLGMRSRDPAYF